MTAYYNENDKKAAAWLRELIKRGLIMDGVVDERSIADLRACDLDGFSRVHLFAGIGGWDLALQLAGWPEGTPVWTGSCPCQPFSAAGKRHGTADKRHLWPEMQRLIAERKPPVVFGEQVASKAGREWLAGVFADVASLGYRRAGADLCAACVGAPHIRQRLFWVADSGGELRERREGEQRPVGKGEAERIKESAYLKRGSAASRLADGHNRDGRSVDGAVREAHGRCESVGRGEDGGLGLTQRELVSGGCDQQGRGQEGRASHRRSGSWDTYECVKFIDGKTRRIKPGITLLAHGIPARVVRLRGYGNAIVPQVAAEFIGSYMECCNASY